MRPALDRLSLALALCLAAAGSVEAAWGKRVALLVGVGKYDKPGFEELPGAENDARALAQAFNKLGFESHVLLGVAADAERATLANIRRKLKAVTEPLTKEDLFVIALAGHGQQLETVDSQKRARVGDYFCPVNAVCADPETLLPIDEVLAQVGDNVGCGLVLIDACRDEPDDPNRAVLARKARVRSRGIQGRKISIPPGMAVLFSCAEQQRAYEHPSARHGLFTYCLLEELKAAKDGAELLRVTSGVTERMDSEEMRRFLPDGRRQTPVLVSNISRVVLGTNRTPVNNRNNIAKCNWLEPIAARDHETAEKIRTDLVRDMEAGDVRAMVRHGHMLCCGDAWTVVNEHAGLEVLRRAAATNDPLAKLVLAQRERDLPGADQPRWDMAAAQTISTVVSRGKQEPLAAFYVGRAYDLGVGVAKDEQEAVRWYRLAADRGEGCALRNLGNSYHLGVGIWKDEEEAVRYYRRASELGNPTALNDLGWCYQQGIGVAKDEQEAVRWYRRGAVHGGARAMVNLGWCLKQGVGGIPDSAQAIQWYRKAAAVGDATAMGLLGYCYANGDGVDVDETEGVKWYRRAAAAGDGQSMCNLGYCYSRGSGVAEDKAEAIKWYRRASEAGNGQGMYNLAHALEHGLGVAADPKEAVTCYQNAVKKGHSTAMCSLGYCYSRGVGVAVDHFAAADLYRRGAAAGDDMAMNNLAYYCYENGLGSERDVEQAMQWYRRAAAKGNRQASQNLRRLGDSLQETHQAAISSSAGGALPPCQQKGR